MFLHKIKSAISFFNISVYLAFEHTFLNQQLSSGCLICHEFNVAPFSIQTSGTLGFIILKTISMHNSLIFIFEIQVYKIFLCNSFFLNLKNIYKYLIKWPAKICLQVYVIIGLLQVSSTLRC